MSTTYEVQPIAQDGIALLLQAAEFLRQNPDYQVPEYDQQTPLQQPKNLEFTPEHNQPTGSSPGSSHYHTAEAGSSSPGSSVDTVSPPRSASPEDADNEASEYGPETPSQQSLNSESSSKDHQDTGSLAETPLYPSPDPDDSSPQSSQTVQPSVQHELSVLPRPSHRLRAADSARAEMFPAAPTAPFVAPPTPANTPAIAPAPAPVQLFYNRGQPITTFRDPLHFFCIFQDVLQEHRALYLNGHLHGQVSSDTLNVCPTSGRGIYKHPAFHPGSAGQPQPLFFTAYGVLSGHYYPNYRHDLESFFYVMVGIMTEFPVLVTDTRTIWYWQGAEKTAAMMEAKWRIADPEHFERAYRNQVQDGWSEEDRTVIDAWYFALFRKPEGMPEREDAAWNPWWTPPERYDELYGQMLGALERVIRMKKERLAAAAVAAAAAEM